MAPPIVVLLIQRFSVCMLLVHKIQSCNVIAGTLSSVMLNVCLRYREVLAKLTGEITECGLHTFVLSEEGSVGPDEQASRARIRSCSLLVV